jgi:hypothetical protein
MLRPGWLLMHPGWSCCIGCIIRAVAVSGVIAVLSCQGLARLAGL